LPDLRPNSPAAKKRNQQHDRGPTRRDPNLHIVLEDNEAALGDNNIAGNAGPPANAFEVARGALSFEYTYVGLGGSRNFIRFWTPRRWSSCASFPFSGDVGDLISRPACRVSMRIPFRRPRRSFPEGNLSHPVLELFSHSLQQAHLGFHRRAVGVLLDTAASSPAGKFATLWLRHWGEDADIWFRFVDRFASGIRDLTTRTA
jgi:hypothetical protein